MTLQTNSSASVSASSSGKISVNQAAQRIIRLLRQGQSKTGLSLSQFFHQTLQVWDAELRQADIDEFLNVACVGVEKGMTEISLAFGELFAQAMDNYHDVLGATFMQAGLAWGSVGDEYTPWDLVQLLVRLTLSDFKPPQPGDPPITFYDPCCGSGAFLLGALDYVDTYYPEVLDRGQIKLFGQELTHVGWLMCRINLHLHQLARFMRRPWSLQEPSILSEAVPPPQSPSELPEQQPLWDKTIDHDLRTKHLVARAPAPPRSQRKKTPPNGLGLLFAQTEIVFSPSIRDKEDEGV